MEHTFNQWWNKRREKKESNFGYADLPRMVNIERSNSYSIHTWMHLWLTVLYWRVMINVYFCERIPVAQARPRKKREFQKANLVVWFRYDKSWETKDDINGQWPNLESLRAMLKDEQRTNRGIYMSLAMGGISHEQCRLSRAMAAHLFSGHGQSPLAESSVTFGACVHSRTPKSVQQLVSWKPEGSRIRTRSAQPRSRPVSTSKCKATSHAMASASLQLNVSTELRSSPMIDASAILRHSYQQGTSSEWSIALGRSVTVSWLNDFLGHDMTVSTLEGGPVHCHFQKKKTERSSRSVMYGRRLQHSGPWTEWSRSICQI
jgi:hypothetical protein